MKKLVIERQLPHLGEIVAMNVYLSPDKVGARDLTRSLTFREWNDRSCKLANALVGLGLEKEIGLPSSPTTALNGWNSMRRSPRGSALERALRAGKTALVHVIGDRTIGHPSLGGNLLGSTRV